MTREIKFRAWCEDDYDYKEVLEVINIYYDTKEIEEIVVLVDDKSGEKKILKYGLNIKLMQYTGLKDKNGKEIYEGDIVQYTTNYYGNLKTDNIQIVKWHEDMEHDGFGQPLATGYLLKGRDWEVIGNIYEHPELLEND